MELLFSSLTPTILRLADAAALDVFGSEGAPEGLISAHVRWGDKGKEMELVPMKTYMDAIQAAHEAQQRRKVGKKNTQAQGAEGGMAGGSEGYDKGEPISVFLTTEDPLALAEFKAAMPPGWRLFVYEAAVSADASVHSQKEEATKNEGASGRHALVALLLALEANDFVLTTG
jgi:hypothetical protein